jgi:hypothetical protein
VSAHAGAPHVQLFGAGTTPLGHELRDVLQRGVVEFDWIDIDRQPDAPLQDVA